jgi:kinesin family protein 26
MMDELLNAFSGKKHTMFGKPVNQKVGVVPTSISWLFKSIQEQRQKNGSRFSVRVSAVEVTGTSGHEVVNDLLLPFANGESTIISKPYTFYYL